MIVRIVVAGAHRLAAAAGDFRAIGAAAEPSDLVLEAHSTGGEIEADNATQALFAFAFSSLTTVRFVGMVLRGRVELLSSSTRLEMRNCTLAPS